MKKIYRDADKKTYVDAPNVGAAEKEYLAKAIDSGFISIIGPFVPEFEEKFAHYIGLKKAVSTQSGTAALHIALHELGIGAGDEVIVPALTFIATVNPVLYVGATPVFADIDRETWNIDPQEIRKKITNKTKAIMPVHLYGNPCNMQEIMAIAKEHGLYVIEDATESLGATYNGVYTGTIGDLGCFSFNGNKLITTGGGGMVVGADEQRLEHIKFLANQARDTAKGFYHTEVGFNYRMTNIEAAMGVAQMTRIDHFREKKNNYYSIYKEELKDVPSIVFQKEYPGAKGSYWLTSITIDKKIDIPAFQEKLLEQGVPTRRAFCPLIDLKPYAPYRTEDYAQSRYIYDHGLCLPSSTLNTEEDIYHACQVIKECI